jgi:transcriptional regulator with XRE-family HTH domain
MDTTQVGVAPLATWRRRVPLTQQELAHTAGLSIGTVRGIEHHLYKTIRPRTIRAIAGALHVPPAQVAEFRAPMGLSSGTAPAAPPDRGVYDGRSGNAPGTASSSSRPRS